MIKNPVTAEAVTGFFWSEYRDSNPRPLGPEPSAIPNFAIPRNADIIMKKPCVVKCQAENIAFSSDYTNF